RGRSRPRRAPWQAEQWAGAGSHPSGIRPACSRHALHRACPLSAGAKLMAAFWENAQIGAQGGPRTVFVAPDPIGEAENARQDRELQLRERADARAQAEADRKSEEAALKEQQQAGALQDSIAQMRTVIDAARQAKELSRRGWFATGFGAETAKGVGGTTATDVASLLNIIGSNTAFDRLTKMREESPTGG